MTTDSKKNPCFMSGQPYDPEQVYMMTKRVQCSHPDCFAVFPTTPDGKYPEHEVVFFKDGLL